MEAFKKLFGSLLALVYHCFDRIVIQGYLPLLAREAHIVYWFREVQGVYPVTTESLKKWTDEYRNWVNAYARNHNIAVERATKGVKKEDHVRPYLKRMENTDSKSIDTTSAVRGTVGSTFSPQDARCPNSCEKATSDFNVPQRFVASIIGALPFGKGQRFLNHGGIVNHVVGGWQASTITTLQSGSAVNTSSWDSGGTNFVSNATRFDCVISVNPVKPNPSQSGWF